MPATDPRDPSDQAVTGSPRLAAVAVLVAGAAATGLGLHPGAALADGGRPASAAPLAAGASWASTTSTSSASVSPVRTWADDDASDDVSGDDTSAADDPSADDAGAAPDDGSGETLGDDDGSGDDGGSADDDASTADDPIVAVVVDRRGRVLEEPRTFAASKTVRAGRLHWTGWSAATATGKGRITVKRHGRHRAVRGTGTAALTKLTVCSDGTPVYRRAVFVVARKTVATVALPGCAALR